MNNVQLIGNLTRDPELRALGSGTSVCSMRVAVNGRRKNAGGDWVNKPGYFDVTTFGSLADVCAEHLAKGRKVAVSGRLDYQEWKTEDGHTRSKVEIIAAEVEFLSPAPKAKAEETAETEEAAPSQSSRKAREKAGAAA